MGQAGNRKFQRDGFVVIGVFVPKETAMTESDSFVETIQRLFETNDINTSNDVIYFFDVSNNDVGISDAWYQSNVIANYRYSFIQ